MIRTLTLSMALAGCAAQPASSPTCSSGSAVVAIYDASQTRMCGCAETSGTSASVGSSLDCTVSSGTTVFYYFIKPRLRHQIRFSGGPASLPTSQAVEATGTTVPFVVVPTTVGTYNWTDLFDTQLAGRLIVI